MKYLLSILLFFVSFVSFSQTTPQRNNVPWYEYTKKLSVGQRFAPPTDTLSYPPGAINRDTTGLLAFAPNGNLYKLWNGTWALVGGAGSNVQILGDSAIVVDDDTLIIRPIQFETDLAPEYAFQDGDTIRLYPRQYIQDSVLITKSGDTLFFPNGDTLVLSSSIPDTVSLYKKGYDSLAIVLNGDTGQYVYTGPGQFIQGQIPFAGSFGELRGSSNFTRDSTKGKIVINPNFTATANLEAGVSIGGDYTMRTNSGDSAYGLRVSTLFRPRSQNKYMHSISADIRFDTAGVGATNTGIIPKAYSAFFNGTEIFSVGLTSTLSTGSPELLLKGTAGNTFYINGSANFQLGTSTNHSIDWRSNNLTRGRLFNNGRWRFGDNTARGSTVSISGGTTSQPPFLIDSGALVVGTKIQNSFEYNGFRLHHVNRDTVLGEININRVRINADATLTLNDAYSVYVFSGTTTTWTLPAVTDRINREIKIKNRGSGAITLNTATAGTDIYTTSAVNTITINAGESAILICDGTYWLKM